MTAAVAALTFLALTSCAAVPAAQEGQPGVVFEIAERMQRGREYTAVVSVDGATSIDFTLGGRYRDLKIDSVTGGRVDPRSWAAESVTILVRDGDGSGPLGFRARFRVLEESAARAFTAQVHAVFASRPSVVINRTIVVE